MPLHPQAQAFVDGLAASSPPGWNELGAVAARTAFSGLSDFFGTGPELPVVQDRLVAGVPVRMYRPKADAVLPVVMFFHGGGWVLGDLSTHDAMCRRIAAASGAAVISVQYGLAPETAFPVSLDQCYQVTQYVAGHGDQFGIQPRRLMVAGDSAGGNLAAAVAIRAATETGPAIAKQILIYPVVSPDFDTPSYQEFAKGYGLTRDAMRWFWDQYMTGHADQHQPLADLSITDVKGVAAAHVITAQYDVLRDEGEAYVVQLQKAGVPVTHKRYDGMLHGFVHFAGLFDTSQEAIQDIAKVIRT